MQLCGVAESCGVGPSSIRRSGRGDERHRLVGAAAARLALWTLVLVLLGPSCGSPAWAASSTGAEAARTADPVEADRFGIIARPTLLDKTSMLRRAGVAGPSLMAAEAGDHRDPAGAAAAGDAGGAADRDLPRVLVKVAPHVRSLDDIIDIAVGPTGDGAPAAPGLRLVQVIESLSLWVLEVTDGRAVEEVLAELVSTPGVVYAAPSITGTFTYVPDDPYYRRYEGWPGQWGPAAVSLPEAWDVTTGSRGLTLAVIDSGIAVDIPDFAGRIVSPYSTFYQTAEWPAWEDIVGHGSGVAGVAAATGDDGFGIAGADWGVGIMPVHTSDASTVDIENEVAGIAYAVDHGADVINISSGFGTWNPAYRDAIDYALASGVPIVASAGNDGYGVPVAYPAAYPGVIAVGATDADDRRAWFSNTGSDLDLVAPGKQILTWGTDTRSIYLDVVDGTSFSAPMVAGVTSLMLSEQSGLSAGDVEAILRETARDLGASGHDSLYGWGLLDAAAAVRAARDWKPTEPSVFIDVPAGHPYASAVNAMYAAGAISGYGNGYFGVNDPVTRQQFSKMILLALGQSPVDGMYEPFVDVATVPGTTYPDDFIALAYELGITTGVSTSPPKYGPERNISRAQVVTMAVRAADGLYPGWLVPAPAGYQPPFGPFSPVHDPAAATAYYNGMLDGLVGVGRGYDMWRNATRGEVAAVLAPLLATAGD